jgi:LmbE family N-acetylglucosaminyl deacetylase
MKPKVGTKKIDFMKLHNSTAEIFVPDGQPVGMALQRITHLGIGAHQDDLELMAFHGILAGYASAEKWFGGVTCTNGSGIPRTGVYEKFTYAQMMAVRRREQNTAATIGQYGVMIQLGYPSSVVKSANDDSLKGDLKTILSVMHPEVVYTHNPADKHDTHIGVVVAAIQAMRELARDQRPKKVIGCEVWRNLDWLPDAEKVLMDVSGRDNLAAALNGASATIWPRSDAVPQMQHFSSRTPRTRPHSLSLAWISRRWWRMNCGISLITSQDLSKRSKTMSAKSCPTD